MVNKKCLERTPGHSSEEVRYLPGGMMVNPDVGPKKQYFQKASICLTVNQISSSVEMKKILTLNYFSKQSCKPMLLGKVDEPNRSINIQLAADVSAVSINSEFA